MNQIFDRTELLLGSESMRRLEQARVIIFGVGGVGSWCAEALVRTGIGRITMVDPDVVVHSNINRQLPALHSTLGMPKVEAMAARLADINPNAEISAVQMRYSAETEGLFNLADYDFVIDAIDSLADKALLIRRATECRSVTLFSSMGAARKVDPSRVRVAEFWQVKGCPLAAALRSRFKRSGEYPARKFKVVYSDEVRQNCRKDSAANGSLVQITAVWGFTLASMVVNSLTQR